MTTCCIIGAGNVASHIANAIKGKARISTVYGRTIAHAETLANALGHDTTAIDNLAELPADADLYIISVSDDAIKEVVKQTGNLRNGIWVHTSGSIPMDVFAGEKDRYGVFYPLQTFTMGDKIDFSKVPLLIEGSDEATTEELLSFGGKISSDVRAVDSQGRKKIHLAAVLACNFVNYLWGDADEILREEGLDLSILMPLIEATLDKAKRMSPRLAQTGPARRGDRGVVEAHIAMLEGDQRNLYTLLSNQIMNYYHKQNLTD